MAIALNMAAQLSVSGTVVEAGTHEPLTGASVILRNAEGKISKYGSTDAAGKFAISTTTIQGHTIEVSMMSFAKQTVELDSASLPLTIVMEHSSTMLKEVAIKADRIREQGDTITYTVGSFAQAHDRSIGDVLKRMPGIDVNKSGKIQYQGKDINKFYIEGSDLMGGKYGIATNGISHDDVGAVEVMENHQPMQVLSGISFSDKAAINIKLKNKAKATWSIHGDAGGGQAWQPEGAIWDGELFAMAAMPQFQSITSVKTNNVGENISAHATDFFSSSRPTGLSEYINVLLPSVPALSEKRTLFNRSALISTNNLWKLNHGELKAQIDYSFNHVTSQAANITTYFLKNGDQIVTESRDGRDRSHSLSGKFIYEVNNKSTFINNTLQTNIDWDNIQLQTTGSLANDQSASLPDYYVSNRFKMIKRFNGKHLVTFYSSNDWETQPQTLNVAINGNSYHQHIGQHAFHTHESAAYSFSVKGITISLEGGVKGYLRSLNTELPNMPEIVPYTTQQVVNTNYFTAYTTPKIEYWLKRINIVLNAPVSFTHYTFGKALTNRSEVYFAPSLNINWKPDNRMSVGLHGGSDRMPMNFHIIHPQYIMSNYRSFKQGVDNFYNLTAQNISANISYKLTRKGIFTNAFVMHSWAHLPYTMTQRLYGNYAVNSYVTAKSNDHTLLANCNIGKTLDFMRGSANINGSFSRNESHLISENTTVNSVGDSWSVGAKINGTPVHWISFDYAIDFSWSRLAINSDCNPWLITIGSSLLINIIPHSKWEWRISGKHYRNELTAGTYKNILMLDSKIVFKMSKRIELSAGINNILNERAYNYTTYNQLTSFESQRWLRGRELLISIYLRK